MFRLSLRLITFVVRQAYLAQHLHKTGPNTANVQIQFHTVTQYVALTLISLLFTNNIGIVCLKLLICLVVVFVEHNGEGIISPWGVLPVAQNAKWDKV